MADRRWAPPGWQTDLLRTYKCGPRLAAATFLYEFYYDVVRDGRYTWEIRRMHQQYGPIVRINPYELHISDPYFYDKIYVGPTRRTQKWHWSAKMFGTTRASVGTVDHDVHRMRRAALNPSFSKQSVSRLEPVIQRCIDRLCERLREFSGTGKYVNLSNAFTCLSADVIGSYAFGRPYGFLESEDFHPAWRKLMMDLSRSTHLMKQLGWAYGLLTCIPEFLVNLVHPLTKELFRLRRDIASQIAKVRLMDKYGGQQVPQTIFHGLFASGLPAEELSTERLTEEGLTIVGAGTVTTAHTLTVIVFHLLSNSHVLEALRRELDDAAAEGPEWTWTKLARLPLLSAVISEGLRMSYGVSHRLQRISPDSPLQYKQWTIPAGTPVSMTQMDMHENETIFPEADAFMPARWLNEAQRQALEAGTVPPEAREARKFLVPFSRGTRACLGINLAYAELHLAIGSLFRPVECGGLDLELFETDRDEVTCELDWFNPAPKLGSKGVRVIVHR